MINPFIVGQRIKTRREQLGLSQNELAIALNLDQGKVSLIEKGGRKIDCIYELKTICDLLKVSTDWLLSPELDENWFKQTDSGDKAVYPRKIEIFCNGTRNDYKAIGAEILGWGIHSVDVKALGEHGMSFIEGRPWGSKDTKHKSPTICVQAEPGLLRFTVYNHSQKDVLQTVLTAIPDPHKGDA